MNYSSYCHRYIRSCVIRRCIHNNIYINNNNIKVLYRDIFVIDDNVSEKQWSDICSSPLGFKHPTSNHIISSYCSFIHKNSTYNFNNLGEFSINLTHAYNIGSNIHESAETGTSTTTDSHSIIVWPDKIYLKTLSIKDIPTITNLFIDNDNIVDEAKLKEHRLDKKTATLPINIVISSVSKTTSNDTAKTILQWFQSAVKGNKEDDCTFLLSGELGGHRNSTSVMVLPSEDSFSSGHCYSQINIQKIVNKLNL